MLSLLAVKNEMILAAANPLLWFSNHNVGPQRGSLTGASDSMRCLAFGRAETFQGAKDVVHWHTVRGTDSTIQGSDVVQVADSTQSEDNKLCGINAPDDDGLAALFLRFATWLAVILVIAAVTKAAWAVFTRSGTGFGQAIREMPTPLAAGALLGGIYLIPLYVLPILARVFVLVFHAIDGLVGTG